MNNCKLSIIIPCYNSSETISTLLDSIVNNDLDKDEYEIVICDDDSTDGFLDIVKTYEDRANISYYKTNANVHCPGNTRQLGLENAKGEWITFIDHDDFFEPKIFQKVFNTIKENDIDTVLCTSFYSHYWPDKDNCVKEAFLANNDSLHWLHGKFYNHEMLNKGKIHFCKDLIRSEDVYFNNLVEASVITNGKYIYFDTDLFTYNWIQRKDSISHYREGDITYQDIEFGNWVYAMSEPYFGMSDDFKDFRNSKILKNFLLAYFFYQQGLYRLGDEYPKDALYAISIFKQKICKELKMTGEDIINYLYQDAAYFHELRGKSFTNIDVPFIERQSLRDFVLNI